MAYLPVPHEHRSCPRCSKQFACADSDCPDTGSDLDAPFCPPCFELENPKEVVKKKCECPVCLYGRKVRDLIHRTADEKDKALIEELYDHLIHAEDDRDYHSIKNDGCRIKHGGISLADACIAVGAERSKEAEGRKS